MNKQYQNLSISLCENSALAKSVLKRVGIGAAIGSGVGATIGGVKGAYKTQDVDERVQHWKSKYKSATTDHDREIAKEKLKYWVKVARGKRIQYAKSKAIRGGVKGALAGGTLGASTHPVVGGRVQKVMDIMG